MIGLGNFLLFRQNEHQPIKIWPHSSCQPVNSYIGAGLFQCMQLNLFWTGRKLICCLWHDEGTSEAPPHWVLPWCCCVRPRLLVWLNTCQQDICRVVHACWETQFFLLGTATARTKTTALLSSYAEQHLCRQLSAHRYRRKPLQFWRLHSNWSCTATYQICILDLGPHSD